MRFAGTRRCRPGSTGSLSTPPCPACGRRAPARAADKQKAMSTLVVTTSTAAAGAGGLVVTRRRSRAARRDAPALIGALSHLPEVYRVPVILRDIQGLSTEEASAVLRVKPQTLKSRLHRGRLILREHSPTSRAASCCTPASRRELSGRTPARADPGCALTCGRVLEQRLFLAGEPRFASPASRPPARLPPASPAPRTGIPLVDTTKQEKRRREPSAAAPQSRAAAADNARGPGGQSRGRRDEIAASRCGCKCEDSGSANGGFFPGDDRGAAAARRRPAGAPRHRCRRRRAGERPQRRLERERALPDQPPARHFQLDRRPRTIS